MIAALAALAALGGCADNNTAPPVAEVAARVAPANFSQIGSSVVFSVNNRDGIIQEIGDHVLYMPSNAICDIASSGYGSTTWDKNCRALRGSITITATIFIGPEGQPYVDFEPAMRFAPDKQVLLFLREGRDSGNHMVQVKYCNQVGYCVDESLADPSLKPFRVDSYSIIGRRIKHFSGYVIAYEQCPDGLSCQGDGGLMRRSGYMVASGENTLDILKENGWLGPKDEH
jgi:hypothetical protein